MKWLVFIGLNILINRVTGQPEAFLTRSYHMTVTFEDNTVFSKYYLELPVRAGGGLPVFVSAVGDAGGTSGIQNDLAAIMFGNWDFKVKKITFDVNIAEGNKILSLDSYEVLGPDNKPISNVAMGSSVTLVLAFRDDALMHSPKLVYKIQIPNLPVGKDLQMARSLPFSINVASGANFTQQDSRKQLKHQPDSPKELIESLQQNRGIEATKLLVQVALPNLEDKKQPEAIKVDEGWSSATSSDLNLIRQADDVYGGPVILKVFDMPEPGFYFDTDVSIPLNLILPAVPLVPHQTAPAAEKVKKKKKWILF
jgi:hypothetical protein